MLSEREFEIYSKFEKGNNVKDNEREDIDDLGSIGLARIGGFSFKNGKLKQTAILTPLGQNIIRRERIMRNPIYRFFCAIVNSSM